MLDRRSTKAQGHKGLLVLLYFSIPRLEMFRNKDYRMVERSRLFMAYIFIASLVGNHS